MNERRRTFGAAPGPDDEVGAGEFQPRPISRPDPDAARRVAEEGGYTSGASTKRPGDSQRRYRTGRTEQLNLKITPQTKARFQHLADQAGVSMNELFERAVQALEDQQ